MTPETERTLAAMLKYLDKQDRAHLPRPSAWIANGETAARLVGYPHDDPRIGILSILGIPWKRNDLLTDGVVVAAHEMRAE